MPEINGLTVSNEIGEKIKYLSESFGRTKTDVIVEAIAFYHAVTINKQRGGKTLIEEPDGTFKEINMVKK